jgi:hypothetical protein
MQDWHYNGGQYTEGVPYFFLVVTIPGPNVIKLLSILKKILNSNLRVREWGSWEFYKSVHTGVGECC